MRTKAPFLFALCLMLLCLGLRADEPPRRSKEELIKLADGLKYQHGEIHLRGGLAKLQLPGDFKYLNPADTETVLSKIWHNPPGVKTLGLLLPEDKTPLDDGCWAVMITYSEDGYVKDDDARKIDFNDLLKKMEKQARDASVERRKLGYSGVELVGWAEPPHYDAETHKLYWDKDLKFDSAIEDTLNYSIRMLGRRGVLELNAIASMDQLPEIKKMTPQILSMVNFNDGSRYADFNPKVDKVAGYGIAALVAGGVAAKLGLFKLIWVFLLAAKKFVVIAVLAVVAWIKKLLNRNKTPAPVAASPAPTPPAPPTEPSAGQP